MERKQFIEECRAKRMTYLEISKLLGLSKQRVHQIDSGYKTAKPPISHKIFTYKKLGLKFELPKGENPNQNGITGGRDYVREWVRIRDKHACQICLKKWTGGRRLDVHHMDEAREGLDRYIKPGEICKWDRENMDKMITLCHKCHMNLDTVRLKLGITQAAT